MALHIEFGLSGGGGFGSNTMPVPTGNPSISETLSAAGTSTTTVPVGNPGASNGYVASLTSDEDGFFAVGPTPDATVSPRRRLKAGVTRDVAVSAGDKIAWALT